MIPYNVVLSHVVEGRPVGDLAYKVLPIGIHLATYKVAITEDGTEHSD